MQKILESIKLKVRTKYKKEEKEMRRTKQGVSLIVLVITIIIMIILASTIIVTLSNSDIIDRANEAVQKTDLQEVQNIASIAWTEAYLDGKTTKAELKTAVESALTKNKVNISKYALDVTTKGVVVSEATLGSIIKSAKDYGKTVDYTVTVAGKAITDWKIFYETENYVYLISSEQLEKSEVPVARLNDGDDTVVEENNVTIGGTTKTLVTWRPYQVVETINPVVQNATLWMANWSDYTTSKGKCAAYFLDETYWNAFKNTNGYKDENGDSYVVGAIATPTAEMFVASWNAKRAATGDTTTYNKKLVLTSNGTEGYYVNDETTTTEYSQTISTSDDLYTWSTANGTSIALASPAAEGPAVLIRLGSGYIGGDDGGYGIRPVICLSSDIPANYGTTTDFTLIK